MYGCLENVCLGVVLSIFQAVTGRGGRRREFDGRLYIRKETIKGTIVLSAGGVDGGSRRHALPSVCLFVCLSGWLALHVCRSLDVVLCSLLIHGFILRFFSLFKTLFVWLPFFLYAELSGWFAS